MEAAPPSYENATLMDPWDIVAPYIPSNDLCSATLVCSRWHATFTPHLWGNPASHFGIENDRVYVALTRFKRTLRTARLVVRSLTHTVHLPPAHAELYNGPHSDWLHDILERLPNLQSLIVQGLPFFDYSALRALRYKRPDATPDRSVPPGVIELPASTGLNFQRPPNSLPTFGLRLLDASRCSNVTSSSLAQALAHFESLLYLDLSYTIAARDPTVLKALRRFYGLQVLKLRSIQLSDDALYVLAPSIGRRVRSLDLRNNNLSDRSVRTLLSECFVLEGEGSAESNGGRSPSLLRYIGQDMLDIYRGQDFERFIRSAFTRRFVGRLAIENVPEGGITHLYIAGNPISVEGVSGLLRVGRLHVFDAHSVFHDAETQVTSKKLAKQALDMSMPGVEKLIPVMSKHVSDSLTFLRIGHAIITKDTSHADVEEIAPGRVELADTAIPALPVGYFEMDATSIRPETFELPAMHTPRHELIADPLEIVVSSAIDGASQDTLREQTTPSGPRRGSAFAPEVFEAPSDDEKSRIADHELREANAVGPDAIQAIAATIDRMTISSPMSTYEGTDTIDTSWTLSPLSPVGSNTLMTLNPAPHMLQMRPRTYSSVTYERNARLNAHACGLHNLHPAMLPHLSTLVLTDVPSVSTSTAIADRLIAFICQCAQEAHLAKAHAKLDYSLPPGRRGHIAALKSSAKQIFALNRLVLEMAPEESTRRQSSQWKSGISRSMTEDRDSETLYAAAETDFTFFGDDDYASFPSLDSSRPERPRSGRNNSSQYSTPLPVNISTVPQHDTVALLSAFRKERKMVHQRQVAACGVDVETEGYWEGQVEVIRQGAKGVHKDETLDYYRNR